MLFGVGPDGHVASLFPHHPAQRQTDAIAVAVHDSPKPPPDRVSLTFECFERSHEVWFLVAGGDKAEAVAAALAPGADRWDVPAAGPRGTDATLWLVDADAAAAPRLTTATGRHTTTATDTAYGMTKGPGGSPGPFVVSTASAVTVRSLDEAALAQRARSASSRMAAPSASLRRSFT